VADDRLVPAPPEVARRPTDPLQAEAGRPAEPLPEVARRLVTVALALPLFLASLLLGGWPWEVLLGLLALVVAWEVVQLARAAGLDPAPEVALPGCLALFAALVWAPGWSAGLAAALLVATLLAQFPAPRRPAALANAGATLLAALLPLLLVALAFLRRASGGQGLTLVVVAAVWAADAAAYFAGRAYGRRPLAPAISPRKSWEGAAAGLLAGTAAGAVAAALAGVPVGVGTVLGAVSAAAGAAGDLAESALKRSAGVKDAGVLLPGHGGVLDRFDSLLLAAPAALLVVRAWGR
jgi:phosphatidate cytidylyltransferase